MSDLAQFPFVAVRNSRGEVLMRPIIPLRLSLYDTLVECEGLLDSGADVNVMPYPLGLALGASWETARTGLRLSGNLAQYEARGLLVTCTLAPLPPVRLAFAWTRSDSVPILLGQVNFFAEFDVCFLRTLNRVEIRPKALEA